MNNKKVDDEIITPLEKNPEKVGEYFVRSKLTLPIEIKNPRWGGKIEETKVDEPIIVEFKAKSMGSIAVKNIEAIPQFRGIIKKVRIPKKD
jgi:hypothetical protein